MKDPFWKRSSFGTLLMHAGVMLIDYFVGGEIPGKATWYALLFHALMVAGYQVKRPTGPVA